MTAPARTLEPAPLPPTRPELLRVAGPHREMGRAQGAALAGDIRAAERTLLAAEPFLLLKPTFLPTAIFGAIARRRARSALERPIARHRPEQAQRLLGLAEGAGVGARTIYFVQGAELLLAAVDWRVAPPPLASCSAVAVGAARGRGGPLLHHNFDYPEFVLPYLLPRESRPEHGYRSLELTAGALSGAIDGINERGLAITYCYAFATDAAAEAVPLTTAISAALERCATTAEAADFLLHHARGGGGLLQLADAGGDVAALELSATRGAVRRPAPGEDLLHNANRYATPSLREIEIPDDAVYSARNIRALRGERIHRSSDEREARLMTLLSARRGALGVEELQEIFSDHGAAGEGSDLTPCRHGPYWATTAMIQLQPRERRMRIAFGPTCRAVPLDFVL